MDKQQEHWKKIYRTKRGRRGELVSSALGTFACTDCDGCCKTELSCDSHLRR